MHCLPPTQTSLELRVVSANITSNEEGLVLDVFRVTDSDDEKVGISSSKCAS